MRDILKRREKLIARQIAELEKYLPFADGPAYHQDRQKICELKAELAEVKKIEGEGE